MNNLTIGRKVAKLRKQLELSTTELANRIGLSQSQISRLENGKQGFRSATLARIAEALGVETIYFFAENKDLLNDIKIREKNLRRNLGKELVDDMLLQFGEIVVTPGYRQLIRRLTGALGKANCDLRILRRLLDRVLSMNNSEREKLLTRLSRK